MRNLADATAQIVDILTAFKSKERLRIVKASLTLLGDELGAPSAQPTETNVSEQKSGGSDPDATAGVHSLAKQWVRNNGITMGQLEHCFHFDQGKVTLIALPGSATSKREQTANAYLAVGLASFLANGEGSFSDTDARTFCTKSGCYDIANHIASVKALKNRVTGSKSTGWKLTAPGLSAAAELVKLSKS